MSKICFVIFWVACFILSNPAQISASCEGIDAGVCADFNSSNSLVNYTQISLVNAANTNGIIDTVHLRFATNATGVIVGTFTLCGANQYQCRDYEAIGAVLAGDERDFSVSLNIETGDYMGILFATGTIEWNTLAGSYTARAGNHFSDGCTGTFPTTAKQIAIYGSGCGQTMTDCGLDNFSVTHDSSGTNEGVLIEWDKQAANSSVDIRGQYGNETYDCQGNRTVGFSIYSGTESSSIFYPTQDAFPGVLAISGWAYWEFGGAEETCVECYDGNYTCAPVPTPTPGTTPLSCLLGGECNEEEIEQVDALNNTFLVWLVLGLALGLSFLSVRVGPYLWFVSCWSWVAMATLVSSTWLQGVAILMAVVCLGLFALGLSGKSRGSRGRY